MKWRLITAWGAVVEEQTYVGTLRRPWLDFLNESVKVKYVTFEVNWDGTPLKENSRWHPNSSRGAINQLDEEQIRQIRICSYSTSIASG